jgi:hypothetical protein
MNQIKGLEVVKQAVEQTEIEQLRAQLATAQAENANLKAKKGQEGSLCKITDKGGLSVYGLGRFPVTLYESQWAKLIGGDYTDTDGSVKTHPGMVEEIKAFVIANRDKLKKKNDKTEEVA